MDDEAEFRPLHQRQPGRGLDFDFVQRVSRRQPIGNQRAGGKAGIGEIAGLVGFLERPAQIRLGLVQRAGPGQHMRAVGEIHAGLVPAETRSFDQAEAEITVAECCAVVAEAGTDHHPEISVGEGGGAAIAVLNAEIDHPAQQQADQIEIGEKRRRQRRDHHRKDGRSGSIDQRWQIDQGLDRAAIEASPQDLIFGAGFRSVRMRRPDDAGIVQITEAGSDGAVAAIHRRVQGNLQRHDGGSRDRVGSLGRQALQPRFRFRQRTGQEFTFSELVFDVERKILLPVPSILAEQ